MKTAIGAPCAGQMKPAVRCSSSSRAGGALRRSSSSSLAHVVGTAAARRPRMAVAAATSSSNSAGPASSASASAAQSHDCDVVVIGAGIGGLSCAALLARYGLQVTVCESHSIPGGAAHAWVRDGYHFESGPSLYSGMDGRGPAANPLAHVLQAIGEELDLIKYDTWNVLLPEGTHLTRIGNDSFFDTLTALKQPPAAAADWRRLQEVMRPLAKAATVLPPLAFRFDPGVAVSAVGRYLPALVTGGAGALQLTGPFSKVLDGAGVKDPFVRRWMDLLCFLLSGLPADGTIAAEVAFMFNEWYRPDCQLDFPRGGSQAMVDALVRGVTKRGGRLMLNAHVDSITTDGTGRADGVLLRSGASVRARRAVVTSASAWDSVRLVADPEGGGGSSSGARLVAEAKARAAREKAAAEMRAAAGALPPCRSFMHLHVGFDAAGLDDLELHHIVVNSWERGVDAEQNVVLISVPSVADPALAPPGKHTLHAYVPATEPYELWEGLDRRSPEYAALKEARSQVLWDAVERVIPDIKRRAEISLVGTPLTHARFLRRHRGSYGPAVRAGEGLFPGPATPLPGLYACGDSTFPGIGLPAVAASGAVCANTLVPLGRHLDLLASLGL